MIPYKSMTAEEYVMTFPDWTEHNREKPTLFPFEDKAPGLTREQAEEMAKPDGAPYSIP